MVDADFAPSVKLRRHAQAAKAVSDIQAELDQADDMSTVFELQAELEAWKYELELAYHDYTNPFDIPKTFS